MLSMAVGGDVWSYLRARAEYPASMVATSAARAHPPVAPKKAMVGPVEDIIAIGLDGQDVADWRGRV